MVAKTLDSNSPNGNQGSPNSDDLEGTNVQPPSTPAPAQLPEQLGLLVSQKVIEALQDPNILKGMKDRRFNQIERKLDDISPVLDKVKELLTPEQREQFDRIQRDAEIDDLKRAVFGGSPAPTSAATSGTQGNAAFDAETIVKALQFDDNDIAVAAVKKAYADNPQQMISQLAQLKITQANIKPNGPAGALPPSGGQGQAPRKGAGNELIDAYNKELAAIPRGSAHTYQRSQLKTKYIKLAREQGFIFNE